jgi:hypothetical protein
MGRNGRSLAYFLDYFLCMYGYSQNGLGLVLAISY